VSGTALHAEVVGELRDLEHRAEELRRWLARCALDIESGRVDWARDSRRLGSEIRAHLAVLLRATDDLPSS
jgi:hypothetical protein